MRSSAKVRANEAKPTICPMRRKMRPLSLKWNMEWTLHVRMTLQWIGRSKTRVWKNANIGIIPRNCQRPVWSLCESTVLLLFINKMDWNDQVKEDQEIIYGSLFACLSYHRGVWNADKTFDMNSVNNNQNLGIMICFYLMIWRFLVQSKCHGKTIRGDTYIVAFRKINKNHFRNVFIWLRHVRSGIAKVPDLIICIVLVTSGAVALGSTVLMWTSHGQNKSKIRCIKFIIFFLSFCNLNSCHFDARNYMKMIAHTEQQSNPVEFRRLECCGLSIVFVWFISCFITSAGAHWSGDQFSNL